MRAGRGLRVPPVARPAPSKTRAEMNQAPPHTTPPSLHDRVEPIGPLTTRRLPFVVHALAACTFLMLTTEFVVAGLLLEISADLGVSVARTGLLITVFAAGMVVGAPTMALLTRRMQRRNVLVLALAVFAVGHVVV